MGRRCEGEEKKEKEKRSRRAGQRRKGRGRGGAKGHHTSLIPGKRKERQKGNPNPVTGGCARPSDLDASFPLKLSVKLPDRRGSGRRRGALAHLDDTRRILTFGKR
ncbi:hypothetical protein LX36DRAFT_664133 [Colletotrichum falcatum]|nr:hypothetical protein LX36DRAFT_664133 [Colletotrichum falcatum]